MRTAKELFEKYGKEVLVRWDSSYDEETDEDTDVNPINIIAHTA